jgi:protein SCO1
MDAMTRRRAIAAGALGSLPVLAGLGTLAAGERVLGRGGPAGPRFAPVGRGSARAEVQRRHLPNVPLVTQDGRAVRFYDDLVKNRKVVLSFVSSAAPRESRKVMSNLAALQRFFGPRVGRDVFLYSIARTPERDPQTALRRWAKSHDAGPGWSFLTGDPRDVERLRRDLGFVSDDPVEDASPAFAVGQIRHGVEREMRWAHCQALARPRVIAHSILLDFGPGPSDLVTWNTTGAAGAASAPIWDCHLVLASLA